MTADDAALEPETPSQARSALGAFALLAVAMAAELWVAVGMTGDRATRVAALAGLVTAKAGVVLTWLMGSRFHRGAATLTFVGIGVAVGYAVVLMLESAFHARIG